MSMSQVSKATFMSGLEQLFREKRRELSQTFISALTAFALLPLGAAAPTIVISVRQILHDLLPLWPSNEASIDDVINAIKQMDLNQQKELSKLADDYGAWQLTLQKILNDQRGDLLEQFIQLFQKFQDDLSPTTVHAVLNEINARVNDIQRISLEMQIQLTTLLSTVDASDKRLEIQQNQLASMSEQLQSLMSIVKIIEHHTRDEQAHLSDLHSGMSEMEANVQTIKMKLDLLENELNALQSSHERIRRKRNRFGIRRKRTQPPLGDELLSRLDEQLNSEFKSLLDDDF
jgi:chromosome segregation ATPase